MKRGDRCEGLYVADVDAHSIDVVSFTIGDLVYDINTRAPLRVFVSSKAPLVNVRAVAIPPKTYYRMDTFLRPNSSLMWPVTDVLLPEKLTNNRVGIFAWIGVENAKTFIPVGVVPVKAAQTITKSTPIFLVVQQSFDAEKIKWRWASLQHDKCGASGQWQDTPFAQVRAGQPVKIDLQHVPQKYSCVEVVARPQNSNDWATLQIHVELPGR